MKTEYKWLLIILIIIASFAVATGVAYLVHHHIQEKDKSESVKKASKDKDKSESRKKASKDKDKSESRKKASKDNNRHKSNDYSYDDDYYYDDDDYYYDDDDVIDISDLTDDDDEYSYGGSYGYSIEEIVDNLNSMTPFELEEGLYFNNIYLSQGNAVIELLFDEDQLGEDVSILNLYYDEAKESFIQMLRENTLLPSSCASNAYDVIMKIYGSNTRNKVTFTIYAYEL